MEESKASAVLMQYKEFIPDENILALKEALLRAGDEKYQVIVSVPIKKPMTTLILSIFLGGIGVDRFYIGDIGVGIAKLLFGWITCGIWPLVDIFMSYKKTKEKNYANLITILN